MKKHLLSLLICGLASISFSSQAQRTPAKPSELTSALISEMTTEKKNEALGKASFEGRLDDVKRLLTSGADLNSETDAMSPTHMAAVPCRVPVCTPIAACPGAAARV